MEANTTADIRKYNNTMRIEKSNSNRRRIIENYVALLAEKRGEEISLDDLAEKSQLSTRTLFRFFGDKKSLNQELETYLESYVSRVAENLQTMNAEEFAKFSFSSFDQHQNLILAYLYTNFGQPSRITFRKQFNVLIFEKIKTQVELSYHPEELRKIYFIISLINANLWRDIRETYGENGNSMGDTAKWAVSTLLRNLNNN